MTSKIVEVNPSDETIRLGPLAVRFLIAGENSSGSVAAFELIVPSAQRLTAPALPAGLALTTAASSVCPRRWAPSTWR